MSPVEIGMLSVAAIVVLVYMGLYIPIALGLVSFVSVWIMSGKSILAFNFLKIAVGDGVTEYNFATIPLFTLMGLLVSKAGLGRDIYDVMNSTFRKVLAGIGMATVGANAVFAAITGSSIASASVFTKISVPEMLRYNYSKRFAVGVVAGSSVLGMIIPPSAMLIIYSFISEQSVGDMFLAGIVPGLLLTGAYIFAIFAMARIWPSYIGQDIKADEMPALGTSETIHKAWPVLASDFFSSWRHLYRVAHTSRGWRGRRFAGSGHRGFAQVDVLERLVVDACRNWSHNGCNLAADYNGIVLQPYVGLCRVAK